ncbi:MAG: hypothetical protein ACREDR_12230, partial [Blastocatellia bacterium]
MPNPANPAFDLHFYEGLVSAIIFQFWPSSNNNKNNISIETDYTFLGWRGLSISRDIDLERFGMDSLFEPFRIKSVERIHRTTAEEREGYLRDADYNLFRIRSRNVMI